MATQPIKYPTEPYDVSGLADSRVLGFFVDAPHHPHGALYAGLPHPVPGRVPARNGDAWQRGYLASYVIQCPVTWVTEHQPLLHERNPRYSVDADVRPENSNVIRAGWICHPDDRWIVRHGGNAGLVRPGKAARGNFEDVRDHGGNILPIQIFEARQWGVGRYWRPQPNLAGWKPFRLAAEVKDTFELRPGAEEILCRKVQPLVKQGLLEAVHVMFQHWELHASMQDRFNPERIRDSQERERLTALNRTSAAGAVSNAEIIREEFLRIEDDLKKGFAAAGSSWPATMQVCARYLAGEFGDGWHVRGYWSERHSPLEHAAETDRLDRQNRIIERHRLGYVENHFAADSLKPLFKRHPRLAKIYALRVGS